MTNDDVPSQRIASYPPWKMLRLWCVIAWRYQGRIGLIALLEMMARLKEKIDAKEGFEAHLIMSLEVKIPETRPKA